MHCDLLRSEKQEGRLGLHSAVGRAVWSRPKKGRRRKVNTDRATTEPTLNAGVCSAPRHVPSEVRRFVFSSNGQPPTHWGKAVLGGLGEEDPHGD